MSETSASLLEQLRHRPDDAESWRRLTDLYTPLIRGWLTNYTVPHGDRDDLVQEILLRVFRNLPRFEHNGRTGAFRLWLRRLTVNCLREFWRKKRLLPLAQGDADFEAVLDQLATEDSVLGRRWDEEHDRHVLNHLLEVVRPRFTEAVWSVFRRYVLEGTPADEVATEFRTTVNAVTIVKSRVMRELRQEGKGLVG